MNHAIVSNRLFILLLGILYSSFYCDNAFSQIVNLENDYMESITIPKIDDEKIKIFIFSKAGNKKPELLRLQNNLNALEALNLIDFERFTIYNFSIVSNDTNEVCVIKNLTLDGDELLPSFNYDPYYIILKTNNTYTEYISSKPEINKSQSISYVTNKQSGKTQFVNFADDRVLTNLIRSSIISQNDSLLQSRISILESKVITDSLFLANKSTILKNERYLGIQYSIPIVYSLSGMSDSEIEKTILNNFSLSFTYLSIPVAKKIGFKINLQFNKTTIQLKNNVNIIDYTSSTNSDSLGNEYQETIIANKVEEKIELQTICFAPQIVYKIKQLHPGLEIYICPGIKFATVLSANYSANKGYLTYGGRYIQGGVDTVFNGETLVNTSLNHLQMKDVNVSLYLPVNASYHIYKNWYFNLGLSYEIGFTNILINERSDKFITSDPNEYNSFLYRQDKISVNCLNLGLGFSYRLSQ
ncbi:MAG: hypothetical protein IPI10_18355 [Bacteroidetes bacterium]|nr:hypothetical protein [Bacteroidota bacterium]HQU96390.1 hypothetical protein [Saprospiraceae bacterium]HQW95004.1 hypothetical protein [Saprospiraceae bacterium]